MLPDINIANLSSCPSSFVEICHTGILFVQCIRKLHTKNAFFRTIRRMNHESCTYTWSRLHKRTMQGYHLTHVNTFLQGKSTLTAACSCVLLSKCVQFANIELTKWPEKWYSVWACCQVSLHFPLSSREKQPHTQTSVSKIPSQAHNSVLFALFCDHIEKLWCVRVKIEPLSIFECTHATKPDWTETFPQKLVIFQKPTNKHKSHIWPNAFRSIKKAVFDYIRTQQLTVVHAEGWWYILTRIHMQRAHGFYFKIP